MILIGDTFKSIVSFNNIYNHADTREFHNVRLNGIKFRDIRFASMNIFENAILRVVYFACCVILSPFSSFLFIHYRLILVRSPDREMTSARHSARMTNVARLCKSFRKFCSNIWMLHAWMFRLSLRRAINIYAIIIYTPRSRFYSSSLQNLKRFGR